VDGLSVRDPPGDGRERRRLVLQAPARPRPVAPHAEGRHADLPAPLRARGRPARALALGHRARAPRGPREPPPPRVQDAVRGDRLRLRPPDARGGGRHVLLRDEGRPRRPARPRRRAAAQPGAPRAVAPRRPDRRGGRRGMGDRPLRGQAGRAREGHADRSRLQKAARGPDRGDGPRRQGARAAPRRLRVPRRAFPLHREPGATRATRRIRPTRRPSFAPTRSARARSPSSGSGPSAARRARRRSSRMRSISSRATS
jgi:hypothetical protein